MKTEALFLNLVCTVFANYCSCPNNYSPLCSSNGKTYYNHCQFQCAAQYDNQMYINYKGPCQREDMCLCNNDYDPVCGTDNLTYKNFCVLKCKKLWTSDHTLGIYHTGTCRRSYPPACTPQCTIQGEMCYCTWKYQPVCGKNGVTYRNQCFLECDAKYSNTNIQIAYYGECKICNSYNPVCGSNGKTYFNPYRLYCASKHNPIPLKMLYYGTCRYKNKSNQSLKKHYVENDYDDNISELPQRKMIKNPSNNNFQNVITNYVAEPTNLLHMFTLRPIHVTKKKVSSAADIVNNRVEIPVNIITKGNIANDPNAPETNVVTMKQDQNCPTSDEVRLVRKIMETKTMANILNDVPLTTQFKNVGDETQNYPTLGKTPVRNIMETKTTANILNDVPLRTQFENVGDENQNYPTSGKTPVRNIMETKTTAKILNDAPLTTQFENDRDENLHITNDTADTSDIKSTKNDPNFPTAAAVVITEDTSDIKPTTNVPYFPTAAAVVITEANDESNIPTTPPTITNNQKEPKDCNCTDVQSPVCGSNDVTYENKCKFECAVHNMFVGVTIKYKGRCKKKKDYSCECQRIYKPICASDGVSYSNRCEFDCAAKLPENKGATIKTEGVCVADKTVSECKCEDIQDTVCASNGQEYHSLCKFNCLATTTNNKYLKILHTGVCEEKEKSGTYKFIPL